MTWSKQSTLKLQKSCIMIAFHAANVLHYSNTIYRTVSWPFWRHVGHVFVVAIYSIHLGAGVSPAAQHLGLLKHLPTKDSERGKASAAKIPLPSLSRFPYLSWIYLPWYINLVIAVDLNRYNQQTSPVSSICPNTAEVPSTIQEHYKLLVILQMLLTGKSLSRIILLSCFKNVGPTSRPASAQLVDLHPLDASRAGGLQHPAAPWRQRWQRCSKTFGEWRCWKTLERLNGCCPRPKDIWVGRCWNSEVVKATVMGWLSLALFGCIEVQPPWHMLDANGGAEG